MKLENRPIINLRWSKGDWAAELVGYFLLGCLITYTVLIYQMLPTIIPVHFNAQGYIDGYGDKIHIIELPTVAVIIFILVTILNRFPQIFNYPTKITLDNAERQYTIATRLLRYLKLGIVLTFLIITVCITKASYVNGRLSTWFLPVVIFTLFASCGYFIYAIPKNNCNGKQNSNS